MTRTALMPPGVVALDIENPGMSVALGDRAADLSPSGVGQMARASPLKALVSRLCAGASVATSKWPRLRSGQTRAR